MRLCALWLIIATTACTAEHENIYRKQILAFGTIVELTLYDVEATRGDELSAAIEASMETFHHDWHAWQAGRLSDINRALRDHGRAALDADSASVLRQALALSAASGGLFHPGLGELVALWGFHSDSLPTAPPAAAEVTAAVAHIANLQALRLNEDSIESTGERLQLDLGGMAKGVIIDRTIAYLRREGIDNAIVNAGGDLRAIGRAGQRPWRIGIRHPRASGVFASLTTTADEAIFTSGDYERFFEADGKRYHHLIDPRTGYPADSIASVTVVHADGATADAAATALFIAGVEDWPKTARAMGIDHVMLIDTRNTVYITPAMLQRIDFEVTPRRILVVPLS